MPTPNENAGAFDVWSEGGDVLIQAPVRAEDALRLVRVDRYEARDLISKIMRAANAADRHDWLRSAEEKR